MEIYEDRPGVCVFVNLRSNFDVHVKCVRYVLEHDQQVGEGEAGEDGVGGGDHLAAAEHGDVDGVGG